MIVQKLMAPLRDGNQIYCEVREIGAPIWLVAVHGIGEHLGRHSYLRKIFSEHFNILQFDLRGHGNSTGKRGFVNNFEEYLFDLQELLQFIHQTYRLERFVLFGHSMGALIAASFIQEMGLQSGILAHLKEKSFYYPERAFLSAPPVKIPHLIGGAIGMLPLSTLTSLRLFPYDIALPGQVDVTKLSHDMRIPEEFNLDPLTLKKINSKLGLALLERAKRTWSRPLRCECPLYVAVGSGDTIVSSDAIIDYFGKLEKGAIIKVFKDAYHELHNEIEEYRLPYFKFIEESIYNPSFTNLPF